MAKIIAEARDIVTCQNIPQATRRSNKLTLFTGCVALQDLLSPSLCEESLFSCFSIYEVEQSNSSCFKHCVNVQSAVSKVWGTVPQLLRIL